MKRREFIGMLGGAAAGWPLAARAQQPGRLIRIGFLTLNSGPSPAIEGFQHGLQQLGYIEGQNLVLIYRWALGKKDRLVNLASELLQRASQEKRPPIAELGQTRPSWPRRHVHSCPQFHQYRP